MTQESVYDQLAGSVGAPGSVTIAKIFQFLADEDEAAILMAASPPADADELSSKTGIPADRVAELAQGLFKKGLMFKSKKAGPTRWKKSAR